MVQKKSVKKEKHSNSIVGFFGEVKKLFLHSTKFLDNEKEKQFVPLLRKVLLFYVGFFIVMMIARMFTISFDLYNELLWFIDGVFSTFVMIFVGAGILHLGVWLFKGKGKFFETYKVVVYAVMLFIIYGFIFLILGLIFPANDSMILEVMNLPVEQQTQEVVMTAYREYLAQPGAIINLIAGIISAIHIFIFGLFGLSKLHKFSKLRSFGAILVPWLIMFVILLIRFMLVSAVTNPLG